MDKNLEIRIANLEKAFIQLTKNLANITKVDESSIKLNVVNNTLKTDIGENDVAICDIAELADVNSQAIDDLAEMVDELSNKVAELEE